MKALLKTILTIARVGALTAVLSTSLNSSAQGVLFFQNIGANGGARAPIYGPEPANPGLQLWGNTPEARPPGTQSYSGPLIGTNYSVQAWYTLNPVADVFQLPPDARPVPGSLTSPSSPGFFVGPNPIIPDPNLSQPGDWPYYVYMQVRAWDNAGGQYPTWTAAWGAANEGSGRAVGWSSVFYQPLIPTVWSQPSPGLLNFESFNLFIVPEPTSTQKGSTHSMVHLWWKSRSFRCQVVVGLSRRRVAVSCDCGVWH